MKQDQYTRHGFTFMETMVVVGAFVILIATAIPSIMNNFFTGRGSVVKDAQDLVHLISLAQSQAASNKLNDHWGINFVQAGTTECNSSRAVDCAIMFKGNDYATRNASYDQIYTLTGSDYFSVLPGSSFYFNKVSGFVQGLPGDWTSTTTIGISNRSASSSITLNSTGTTLFGSSARYRKKITFDNSSQARNLTDFPVLVHLSSSNFDFSHTQSAGQDIRFYDSDDTTPLSYEIEKWTGSEAWIWVKVPQIDASSATDYIYMHYGDLSLADGQNKTDVWSYYYVMVQHMNDITSLTINDSTSNAYNGTKNALGPTVETAGKIGEAQYFNNAAARITMSSPFDITGDVLTLEAYVKPVSGLSAGVAVGKTLDGTTNYKWFMGSANSSGAFRPANGMDTASFAPEALMDGTRSITQDAWTYQAFVYRGSDKPLGNKGRLDFLNGVKGSLYGTTHVGDIDSANADYSVVIGNADNGGSPFVGYVDEVRVSNVARSDEYFAAQYMSMNETFNTYGSEEPL